MKPVDIKHDTYINCPVESNIKKIYIRFAIMYEFQSIKIKKS